MFNYVSTERVQYNIGFPTLAVPSAYLCISSWVTSTLPSNPAAHAVLCKTTTNATTPKFNLIALFCLGFCLAGDG